MHRPSRHIELMNRETFFTIYFFAKSDSANNLYQWRIQFAVVPIESCQTKHARRVGRDIESTRSC